MPHAKVPRGYVSIILRELWGSHSRDSQVIRICRRITTEIDTQQKLEFLYEENRNDFFYEWNNAALITNFNHTYRSILTNNKTHRLISRSYQTRIPVYTTLWAGRDRCLTIVPLQCLASNYFYSFRPLCLVEDSKRLIHLHTVTHATLR